jgi:hypothetical protein
LKVTSVRLGEWDLDTDPDCYRENEDEKEICAPKHIDIEIAKTIVHPLYNHTNKNHDIALLKLVQNVTFNDYVQPICLPLDDALINFNYTDHSFDATGYGK